MAKWLTAVALLWAALATPAADTAPDPVEAATHAFADMRSGWNAGDIEAALAAYWDSTDITWINRAGVSRGFDDFAAEMRAAYANAPETMGVYTAEILDGRALTQDSALIVARWDISLGEERLYGGISTMLWRRIDGEWKIVLEHAS
jgi:ketosteroid isomerase-like protein